MTHTVILDETERDRRFVNHLNKSRRHCRISVVTPKNPLDGHPMINRRLVWFEKPRCQS